MTLEDADGAYKQLSGLSSQNVRYLAIAGLAWIWLLCGQRLDVPRNLLWPGGVLLLALALDFLQYTSATALWGDIVNKAEKRGLKRQQNVEVPRSINYVARFFFWSKSAVVVVAYVLLFSAIVTRLHIS